jgi:hypothetical protein
MRLSNVNGQIVYDPEEFYNDYGNPCGQSFTFEVTSDAVTYVYADVVALFVPTKWPSNSTVKT